MIRDEFGAPIPVLILVGSPQVLSVGTSSNSVALEPNTIYRIMADVDCHIRFGASGISASATDNPIVASFPEFFRTDASNTTLAAIATSSGSMYICKISSD